MKALNKLISLILSILLVVSAIPLSAITVGAETDDFPEITVGERIPIGEVDFYQYRFVPKESGWYQASVTDWDMSYGGVRYSGVNVLLWDSSKNKYVGGIDTSAGYPELNYQFDADAEYFFMIMFNHRVYYHYYFTVEKTVPAADVSILQGDAVTKAADSAFDLSPRLAPNNATPEAYTWSSSDESVATVDPDGTVSCIAPGKAIITVTTENGLTASCEVTVIEVEAISDGESKTARNKEEVLYRFIPTSDGMYEFSSSANVFLFLSLYDSQMYTIVNDLTSSIRRELKAGETYYVKAQADLWGDEGDYEYEISVNKMLPATGVVINQGDSVSAYKWQSITLTAGLTPQAAISEAYTWSSSDESVATVDQDGTVSCFAPGKATITVTTETGLTANCEVTVKEIPALTEGEAQTVTVADAYRQEDYFSFTPAVSGTYRFSCRSDSCDVRGRLYDANMQSLNSDSGTTLWAPLEEGTPYYLKVVSFPYAGEFEDDDFCFTVSVEKWIPANNVTIVQGTQITGCENTKLQLEAALTPENATRVDYTWSSSDESVATVDRDGAVSCIAPGKAIITVTTETGLTASCEVTVKKEESNIESLEITKAPDNPVFLARGFCSPDFKGMSIRIHYRDGSVRNVTFDDENLPIGDGVNEVPFEIDGKQGTIMRTGFEDFLLVYQDQTCKIDCLEPRQIKKIDGVNLDSFSPDAGRITGTVIFTDGTSEPITVEKTFGPTKVGPSTYRYWGRFPYGLLNIDYGTDGKSYVVFVFNQEIEYHAAEECVLGDVDGDGTVTTGDITYLQRKLTGIPIPFVFHGTIADADADGSVTVMDATYLQRWLAGLKSNDNIGKAITQ